MLDQTGTTCEKKKDQVRCVPHIIYQHKLQMEWRSKYLKFLNYKVINFAVREASVNN